MQFYDYFNCFIQLKNHVLLSKYVFLWKRNLCIKILYLNKSFHLCSLGVKITERRKRRKQAMAAMKGEVPEFTDKDEDDVKPKFEMPMFGNSPGPTPECTPTVSRASTPRQDVSNL